jgi:hypothetical protein
MEYDEQIGRLTRNWAELAALIAQSRELIAASPHTTTPAPRAEAQPPAPLYLDWMRQLRPLLTAQLSPHMIASDQDLATLVRIADQLGQIEQDLGLAAASSCFLQVAATLERDEEMLLH